MAESVRYYDELLLENGFELERETIKVRRFKNEGLGLPLSIEDRSEVFNIWVMPLEVSQERLTESRQRHEAVPADAIKKGRSSNVYDKSDTVLRKLCPDNPVDRFQVNTKSQAVRYDFLKSVLAEYLRNVGATLYSSQQVVNQTEESFLIGEEESTNFSDTPLKMAQTKVRTFQEKLRKSLLEKISKCELTNLDMPELLVASHIKPVKNCTEEEMQDLDNVLLLSPNIDRLFDRGLITFGEDGYILLSPQISALSRSRLGLSEDMKLSRHLNTKTKTYLKYHRENIFQKTRTERHCP